MGIVHHPDEATLISYAAGALPEALSAVVATHLMICPQCRQGVREMEDLGALLIGEHTSPAGPAVQSNLTPSADLTALPNVSEIPQTAPVRGHAEDDHLDALDRALVRLTGEPLNDIPWKRLGFGVMHCPISLAGDSSGDLRLIKVAKGQTMPEHGHGGSELTLVLHGAYTDEVGTFRAGDIADLGDDIEHRPIADHKDGCVCLIASEQRARFTGVIGRLLQPLSGL